jgi:hypothetical protein
MKAIIFEGAGKREALMKKKELKVRDKMPG